MREEVYFFKGKEGPGRGTDRFLSRTNPLI